MIFGEMLINNFLVHRKDLKNRKTSSGITVLYRKMEEVGQKKRVVNRETKTISCGSGCIARALLFMCFLSYICGIVPNVAVVNIIPQT